MWIFKDCYFGNNYMYIRIWEYFAIHANFNLFSLRYLFILSCAQAMRLSIKIINIRGRLGSCVTCTKESTIVHYRLIFFNKTWWQPYEGPGDKAGKTEAL